MSNIFVITKEVVSFTNPSSTIVLAKQNEEEAHKIRQSLQDSQDAESTDDEIIYLVTECSLS